MLVCHMMVSVYRPGYPSGENIQISSAIHIHIYISIYIYGRLVNRLAIHWVIVLVNCSIGFLIIYRQPFGRLPNNVGNDVGDPLEFSRLNRGKRLVICLGSVCGF